VARPGHIEVLYTSIGSPQYTSPLGKKAESGTSFF
jgi:hypothetical protein